MGVSCRHGPPRETFRSRNFGGGGVQETEERRAGGYLCKMWPPRCGVYVLQHFSLAMCRARRPDVEHPSQWVWADGLCTDGGSWQRAASGGATGSKAASSEAPGGDESGVDKRRRDVGLGWRGWRRERGSRRLKFVDFLLALFAGRAA